MASADEEVGQILSQDAQSRVLVGRECRDALLEEYDRSGMSRVLQRWSVTKHFLPQSTMGKAIHYALEQWESLEVYLQDPLIEIDNNLVENAIRPTARGKKNWLFFGDANAAEVIYSIIESRRRRGVEPYSYLRDVLKRLPAMINRQIKDITTKAWAAANKVTVARKAA